MTERPAVGRGDVWLVNLDPVVGSEQAKTRPCVVMQRDSANRASRTTVVVPFSDAKNKTVSIVQPLLRAGDGGLTKDSVALCLQVRAVDRVRLREKLGVLCAKSLNTIGLGVREILDLEQRP